MDRSLAVSFCGAKAMNATVQNVGALLGIWGVIWYAWDSNAEGPGWILGSGLACIAISYLI